MCIFWEGDTVKKFTDRTKRAWEKYKERVLNQPCQLQGEIDQRAATMKNPRLTASVMDGVCYWDVLDRNGSSDASEQR